MSTPSSVLLAQDELVQVAAPSTELSPSQALMAPAAYKVIYVYSAPAYETHRGRLKVGDATLHTDKNPEEVTQEELETAARKRIDSYTKTTDFVYELEHVELALRPASLDEQEQALEAFRDYAVHSVLMRSGVKKGFAREDKKSGEWFKTDLATVQQAIAAVKARELYLVGGSAASAITLRPEQEAAVKETKKVFKHASLETPRRMLWNAKMRFGKTLTAYSLMRELEDCRRVLILTHRPDVNASWWEDFQKLGLPAEGWTYGSKRNALEWADVASEDKFVWFASIQDLRGSYHGDKYSDEAFAELKKNEALFSTEWDLVITDEAHEGTLTELAKRMFGSIQSKCFLDLSGTPFNIIDAENWDDEELARRFAYDGRYHWSYPDERKAKRAWADAHGEQEPNPYADLPEVRFVTYDVSDSIASLREGDLSGKYGGIGFTELFKTRLSEGKRTFVHEREVKRLLSKLRGEEEFSNDPALFPYHDNFANYFNHTLWMLPNVPACEAMEELLNRHSSGFGGFKIVNATGMGGATWDGDRSALDAVKKAIAGHKNTITLSQQMLTTGVTVTPWTAVFMLNNTTSPMLYMQTAFRAASPGSLPDGRMKELAYVFDFNPDRCLREIIEVATANARESEKQDPVEQDRFNREAVNDYLEYISILSLTGSKFVAPNSERIMEQLNEAYISEVVEKGFDSPKLWNNQQLQKFDIEKVKVLELLRKLQGGKETDTKKGLVSITELSPEEKALQKELAERAKTNPPLDTDDASKLEELDKKTEEVKKAEKKNRQNAVSILAGVAARLPMLVYASPAETAITPENFAELIDDESWREFMPKNLLRIMPEGMKILEERQEEALGNAGNVLYWEDVRRFFDPVIFSLSCERIRRMARSIDEKEPLERAFRTAALFSYFKNPDKETVLTPFRVVSMQYAHTLGGLQFLDLEHSTSEHVLAYLRNCETGEEESHPMKLAVQLLDAGTHELAPRWKTSSVDPVQNDQRDFWEDSDTTVFDINSKTALYPLYAAASLYYEGKRNYEAANGVELDEVRSRELWQEIVKYQIFVNCRVPYSAKIAQRVLAGYNDYTVNTSVVDVLEVRSKLKEVRLPRGEGKKGARPLTNEEEALLWRSFFNPAAMRSKLTEDLVKGLLMTDDEKMEALLKQLEESESASAFSCVVSNPPYQINTGGKRHQVYADFYLTSWAIGRYSSMIFPLGWQRSTGKASGSSLHPQMRKDSHLVSVNNFYETKDSPITLFPEAGTGGVSIVFRDAGSENDLVRFHEYGIFLEERDFSEVKYWSDETQKIFTKLNDWREESGVGTTDEIVSSWNPFGLNGFFTTDPGREEYQHTQPGAVEGLIAYYTRNKDNAKYSIWSIPERFLVYEREKQQRDKWKLIWPKSGAPTHHRRATLLEPEVLFSDTFIGAFFEEASQATNFETYLKTLLYRFCVVETATDQNAYRIIHRFVPNLSTVLNPRTKLVGWQSDWTDEDLKTLFKDILTEEDWAYIERVAVESDPAGAKP